MIAEEMGCIYLAQGRPQKLTVVDTAINLHVS
jgi:hypothetical protein